jgi:hypothetical protein
MEQEALILASVDPRRPDLHDDAKTVRLCSIQCGSLWFFGYSNA